MGEAGIRSERQVVTEFIDKYGVTKVSIGDIVKAVGETLGPRSMVDEERLKELALDQIRSTQEYADEMQKKTGAQTYDSTAVGTNDAQRNEPNTGSVDDDGDVVMCLAVKVGRRVRRADH